MNKSLTGLLAPSRLTSHFGGGAWDPGSGLAPPALRPVPRALVTVSGLALVASVAVLDHLTAGKLSLSILYLVPILLVAIRGRTFTLPPGGS